MTKFTFFLAIILSFLFAGCATISTQKAEIFIKSPLVKINDIAVITTKNSQTNLQIFSFGKSVLQINIRKNICINGICFDKIKFNERFFGYPYYGELLSDILQKKAIFSGKNIVKLQKGFEQNISKNFIKYNVIDNNLMFENNKTKIILRDVDEIHRSTH